MFLAMASDDNLKASISDTLRTRPRRTAGVLSVDEVEHDDDEWSDWLDSGSRCLLSSDNEGHEKVKVSLPLLPALCPRDASLDGEARPDSIVMLDGGMQERLISNSASFLTLTSSAVLLSSLVATEYSRCAKPINANCSEVVIEFRLPSETLLHCGSQATALGIVVEVVSVIPQLL